MPLVILGLSIVLLLLLIARLKVNAFLALLLTAFAVGTANGMAPDAVLKSILKGIGETMGSLILILVFGAILGKLIEESGAAHTISYALTDLFGQRRIQLSVLVTGFIVGLPMIYNASFLVLIPLIYTLSATARLPLMYIGIPLSSALSVTHGYLPPHPAPTSIAVMYHADVNRTLLYGLLLAVPAALLAGPVLSRFFRHIKNQPPPELYKEHAFKREELPGLGISLFTTLVPVLLMLAGAIVTMMGASGRLKSAMQFLGDPNVALCLAVLAGFYTLGTRRGRSIEDLMKSAAAGAASVTMVILIIATGGAFKQVLLDGGTGDAMRTLTGQAHLSPILLAWGAAALLRLALGSATVAAITAAGIVLPIVPASGVAPELLVIATTSGSLMFSHFNDIGFWMFKEYYGVTVRQTFQIWTVMESIVAVAGLAGVLILNLFVAPPASRAASRRVFYVNSYHEGYPPSDESMGAIREMLKKAGIETRVAFLDAKRSPDEEELAKRGRRIAAEILAFHPDVLIVSDDDAVRYVVVPQFRTGPFPIVFCGVNWSADQYRLDAAKATGMLEVVPVEEAIRELLASFPGARKLRVLSENSVSERSNRELLDPKYRALGLEPSYALVPDFEAWKREFLRAQAEADLIYLPTNGAIRGWDAQTARTWVRAHIAKPIFTCDDFMMAYAAFGLTKVAKEQGEWAAGTALRILKGARPADIPIVRNRQTRCFVNPGLASRIGFSPPGNCAVRE